MITISEKDGATIIVIESPSGSEQRVIEQAKRASQVMSSDVWSKFACNKKKAETSPALPAEPAKTSNFNGSLPDEDDYPF